MISIRVEMKEIKNINRENKQNQMINKVDKTLGRLLRKKLSKKEITKNY